QDNQGTFRLSGGSVFMPNDPANSVSGEFTNSVNGIIIGNGLFKTGFGSGGAPDYGIMNKGVINANATADLILDPEDAFNASGGTITGGGTIMGFTTVENSGFLKANNGDFTINPLGAGFLVNNSGGVISNLVNTFTADAVFTNNGILVNTGTFAISSGGAL